MKQVRQWKITLLRAAAVLLVINAILTLISQLRYFDSVFIQQRSFTWLALGLILIILASGYFGVVLWIRCDKLRRRT